MSYLTLLLIGASLYIFYYFFYFYYVIFNILGLSHLDLFVRPLLLTLLNAVFSSRIGSFDCTICHFPLFLFFIWYHYSRYSLIDLYTALVNLIRLISLISLLWESVMLINSFSPFIESFRSSACLPSMFSFDKDKGHIHILIHLLYLDILFYFFLSKFQLF